MKSIVIEEMSMYGIGIVTTVAVLLFSDDIMLERDWFSSCIRVITKDTPLVLHTRTRTHIVLVSSKDGATAERGQQFYYFVIANSFCSVILFADESFVIQYIESALETNQFLINQICKQYNREISTIKTNVMPFRG